MTLGRTLRRLFACLLLTLVACQAEEEAPPEIIRGVLTAEVRAPGQAQSRSFSGLAQSRSRTDLSFRVAGEVAALHVKTGDLVEAGALVAELDPTDYQIEAQEARASLAQARAGSRNADAAYQRVRALYEREGVSKDELDASRADAESNRANLDAARQRERLARQKLGYATLRAPSTGAISDVPVEISENVSAGQGVAVLQTGGPPEVEIAIPEALIGEIREGDSIVVRFDALPGDQYEGQVRKVGIAPSDGSTTFPVTIQVNAEWERIRPGMAAQATFRFAATNAAAIVVPASAIGHDREGHYVFVVEPDEDGFATARRVAVTVGGVAEGGLAVDSGLGGGETIAIAGVPRIDEGLRVRVLAEGDWP